MAKSDRKKLTVYPDPSALAIVGDTTPALNQAVECWARVIAEATHANATAFSRPEWNFLADCCNGLILDTGVGNPAVYLYAEAEDGHRLNRTGDKWFGGDGADLEGSLKRLGAGKATKGTRTADAAVAGLVKRLQQLDYVHAWAMLMAIQFFWDHPSDIDHQEHDWWTLPFRRALAEQETADAASD